MADGHSHDSGSQKFIVRLATSKSRQSLKKSLEAHSKVKSAIGYRP